MRRAPVLPGRAEVGPVFRTRSRHGPQPPPHSNESAKIVSLMPSVALSFSGTMSVDAVAADTVTSERYVPS